MAEVVSIIVKVMIPLLACSLISLALTIERLIFWAKIKSREVVKDMLGLVKAGEFENALKVGKGRCVPLTSHYSGTMSVLDHL